MNKYSIFILKALRKLYLKTFFVPPLSKPDCEQNPDIASEIIYNKLTDDKPCMIARFGANELLCMSTYKGVKENNKNIFTYITGKSKEWWWNERNLDNMHYVAGFYPREYQYFEKFCELMIDDIKELDILGCWLSNERNFENDLKNVTKIEFRYLEPFYSVTPWTKSLAGKKVLVVHPFADTILKQYARKELLFAKKEILPDFELIVMKSVQSAAGVKTPFANWFEALDYMKDKINKIDFDICIIGAGAYGFPLAAHVKRMGKKAFHLGGITQLLFGIRGKRWEDPNHRVETWKIPKGFYSSMMNEYWVHPSTIERPQNANIMEGACYW